jgi:biopolymer transport protein ExbB
MSIFSVPEGHSMSHRLHLGLAFLLLAGVPPALAQTAEPSAAVSLLPQDLSVRAMFQHADIIVQAVMIGLLAASVLTWTILVAKLAELTSLQRAVRRAIGETEHDRTLTARRLRLGKETGPGAVFAAAAAAEMQMSQGSEAAGTKERIESCLHRIEVTMARRVTAGTGLLATIGSTAPFVGLFGTVWGIMNSFIGISQAHTTNLAVVAPGIAEALLATATGLVAAIPAVVIYNVFARAIGGYRANLANLSASILRLASRELDLPRTARAEAA